MLQGDEHKGLYVEDEDNFYSFVRQPDSPYLTSYYVEEGSGSVRMRGSQYNDDVNLYTRSGGVTCYETKEVELNVGGTLSFSTIYTLQSNGTYTPRSGDWRNCSKKTYYTRSNGAFRYTTNKVSTALYEDGGSFPYPIYKRIDKKLYEEGKTENLPAYKAYGGKVYDPGKKYSIQPAEFEIETVTALTI